MSSPQFITDLPHDFSLHRRPEGTYDLDVYTLDAPQWYVSWTMSREEQERHGTPTGDLLDWHIERGMRQLVEGILDNPVVKEAVDTQVRWALEDAKENLLKRLYRTSSYGTVTLPDALRIVEEELNGNRNT